MSRNVIVLMTWKEFIKKESDEEYYKNLHEFIYERYEVSTVYPEKKNIYSALALTPLENTNVVILGQDPYHGANQAHGLSFSVANTNAKFPPSLGNIFKELDNDLGISRTNSNLTDWAKQGVLMLNTVLTVEAGRAGSHRGKGWETFTDKAIERVNKKDEQVIFVLWGADARKKEKLVTNPKHKILKSAHPSPLAAYRGFFGSKPFSTINNRLKEAGKPEIKW